MKLMKLVNSVVPARLVSRIVAMLAIAAVLFGTQPSAHAALDTNITGIVTDLTTFFGSIQTLVIAVVVFGLAIGYAKMLRRK